MGVLFCHLCSYNSVLKQVYLVAKKDFQGVMRAKLVNHCQPLAHVLHRVVLCHIEHDNCTHRIAEVLPVHRCIALSTHRVPQVQADFDFLRTNNFLDRRLLVMTRLVFFFCRQSWAWLG